MQPWYFVRHLPISQQRPGERYEVQLLRRDGRAVATARYENESTLTLNDVVVRAVVLDAGRAQPEGLGDYVDDKGVQTPPF